MPKPRGQKHRNQSPRVRKNHQIRAQKVRVIDANGENLGILSLEEAIDKAKEAELDLIEISEKADPPVTRIMDWGKYVYQLEKKDGKNKNKPQAGNVIKGVRIGMTTSPHDLGVKAKNVDKFFKKGYKVRVELVMRGREKGMREVADQKIEEFLQAIEAEYEMEQEPKKSPRGGMQFIIKPK